MIKTLFLTLLLSAIAGACYRYGGWEKGLRWVREVGVGVCLMLETLLLGSFNFGSILCMGSVWVETSYFKKKGTEAKWLNWLFVGLSFSVALLPWFIWNWFQCGCPNIGFLIRIPVCAVLTVVWQEKLSEKVSKKFNIGKDITDEVGRGAIQILTMPLLLIQRIYV